VEILTCSVRKRETTSAQMGFQDRALRVYKLIKTRSAHGIEASCCSCFQETCYRCLQAAASSRLPGELPLRPSLLQKPLSVNTTHKESMVSLVHKWLDMTDQPLKFELDTVYFHFRDALTLLNLVVFTA
jgi:hypothetical protein